MIPESRAWSILIVEDDPMLAYTLEEVLIEDGFVIAGVIGTLQAALATAESCVCDAAIVDTNLKGESSGSVALALAARGIPYIVLSGYSLNQRSTAFAGAHHLQKPCQPDRLIQALRTILSNQ